MSNENNTTPALALVLTAVIDGKYDGNGMSRLIEAVNLRGRYVRLQQDMRNALASEIGGTAKITVRVKTADGKTSKEVAVRIIEKFNSKVRVETLDAAKKVYKARYSALRDIKAPVAAPVAL